MKDYTFGKNKEFILGYEVRDNQIIVKYAKNKTISFPYSKEKEIKILNKMKEQVLSNKDIFDKKTKDDLFTALAVAGFSGVLSAITILLIIAFGVAAGPVVFGSATLGVCLSSTAYTVLCKSYLNDIQKNQLFLDNKNNIENMMLENTKELDKTLVETNEAKLYNELQQPQFTLNTLNQLTLKELKVIIESINHSRELEVETVAAFKETLKVLQKSKKKEKIKRK